jgi:O-methyltransferase domain
MISAISSGLFISPFISAGACWPKYAFFYAAARAGARILVVDPVVGAANEPQFARTLDIAMMVTTRGGKERTSAEWRSLLTAAGFGVSRIIPTASYASVVEAIRD